MSSEDNIGNSHRNNESNGSRKSYLDYIIRIIDSIGLFAIAMTIIIAFIIFTTVVILKNDLSFDNFKDIASIWGVWIGSVIGYYFGSRPVEALTRRIEEVLDTFDDSSESYEEEINDLMDDMDDLEDKYDKAVKDIQYLVIKYGEHMEKDMIERLKTDYEVVI